MGVNYNPAIVTNGLVLALDAANPKSYSGSGITWTDVSGNRIDANKTGAESPTYPTWNSTGYFSFNGGVQSMYFNGVGPISNNFTISAWVNSTDITAVSYTHLTLPTNREV